MISSPFCAVSVLTVCEPYTKQSRSQRPRSFWLATGIATSGQVQLRKSAIHGLPITLRMLRVKSDKSDWFWSQSIVCLQSHSKPECRWAWPGVPIFPAHDKRDPWGRGCTRRNANRCYSLRNTYLISETFQILLPTPSLIFTVVKLFHEVIWERTKYKASNASHP